MRDAAAPAVPPRAGRERAGPSSAKRRGTTDGSATGERENGGLDVGKGGIRGVVVLLARGPGFATLDRSMATDPLVSVTTLGVSFTLPPTVRPTMDQVHAGLEVVEAPLRRLCGEAMHRQRRTKPSYLDAMTAITLGHPEQLLRMDIFAFASVLCHAVSRPTDLESCLLELDEFEPLKGLRTRFVYLAPPTRNPRILEGIPHPSKIHKMESGRGDRGVGHIRRALELDLSERATEASSVDWPMLSLLAVLAHLRCDFETMLDTGFLRVRRCERHACLAYYHVDRMAGRSRFCSSTCRACAAREQGMN